MNSLLKKKRVLVPVFLVLLYAGYETFLSRKLSPPSDSERLTVSFRVPEGVTLLPLEGLYESSECTDTGFTAGGHTYQTEATMGVSLPFVSKEGSLRTASIAKDGGGRCQWKLSRVDVHFRLSDDVPLSKGKKVFDTSYLFEFRDWGIVNTNGTGSAKKVHGDLDIRTDFFPMVTQYSNMDISLKFFGGDTDYEKWSRRYRLSDTDNIVVEPIVYLGKVVTLLPPEKTDNWLAVYPDGSRSEIPYIYPNYEKLLSMK